MENKKGKLGSRLAGSEAFLSVAASLVCIVIGLLLGLIVLAIINAEHAFGDGLMVILQSGFKSPRNMGTVLANAAPLIAAGQRVFGEEEDIPDAPAQPARRSYNNDVPAFLRRNPKK